MKKKFIFLSLVMFCVICCGKALSDEAQLGVLYEYIYSPTHPTADKAAAINWMKSNFDEHNIMLISGSNQVRKTPNAWTMYVDPSQYLGVDSLYLKSFSNAEARNVTWGCYWGLDTLPMANSAPWILGAPARSTARATSTPSIIFQQIKDLIANAGTGNVDFTKALIPIKNFTSEFKDGSLIGSANFSLNKDIAAVTALQDADKIHFRYNFILAEAYHKYGSEEHYFIPRKYMNNLSGRAISLNKNQNQTATFEFQIDPTWNYKYLYVIAIAECVTGYENLFPNCAFDVAVNKVPDISDIGTAQPLIVEIEHSRPENQCLQVDNSSTTNVVYRITNPNSFEVNVLTYLDKNKSMLGEFLVDLNKDTFRVSANSNTTLIATVKAPTRPNAAAFTIGIMPRNAATGQMPVINEVKTVVACKEITTLVMGSFEDIGKLQLGEYANSYSEEMAIIPTIYHDMINTEMFSGYIYSNITSYRGGYADNYAVTPSGGVEQSGVTLIGDNLRNYMSDAQYIYTSNHLVESELNFLNDIIAKGKHLALFIDKSAKYATSNFATPNEKAGYQSLFNSLGVTYKDEFISSKLEAATGTAWNTTPTMAKGMVTDSLGLMPSKSQTTGKDTTIQLQLALNTTGDMMEVWCTDWQITNSTTTKKVYFYNDAATTNAAVKVTKGNQKMFLAGFGMYGVGVNSMNNIAPFFDNLTAWWYGYRQKLRPRIDIDKQDYDMGDYIIGQDSPVITEIELRNIGDPIEGPLIIYDMKFINDDDGSFTINNSLAGDTIQPGTGKKFSVVWQPQNVITYTGRMEIQCNDPDNPLLVLYFNGVSLEPVVPLDQNLEIDPADEFHAFTDEAGVPKDSPNKTWYLMIVNGGAKPLQFSSIRFSDDTDTEIYQLLDADFTQIAPLSEVEVRIRFRPVKEGEFDGSLVIETNDPDTPIKELDFYGKVGIIGINEEIAKVFNCSVSPNPVNEVATISYSILGDLPQQIQMNIIDNSGRYVSNIVSTITQTPGNYTKTFDVRALTNGTYYLEYMISGKRATTPIVILR